MVILASKSPRRLEILSQFIDFEVKTKDMEEDNKYYSDPAQLVLALSFEKGIDVAIENPDDIVISSDTVVVIDGEVLGKPVDRQDAYEMLKKLSGKVHCVYSGYSLFKINEKIKYSHYEVSKVKFKDLSDEMINDYLDTEEYLGKAGSYAVQGYGKIMIEGIDGDYDNIVGLPISRIYDDMKRLFNIDLLKECNK